MSAPTLVVLEGDQTGQELLLEALRVLDRSVIDLEVGFERYDLSLENRRATSNRVVLDAAEALKLHGLGLKAATITPEDRDDVGSPNRILREADRRQSHRAHRAKAAPRTSGRRDSRSDLGRAHGGRGCLRCARVA